MDKNNIMVFNTWMAKSGMHDYHQMLNFLPGDALPSGKRNQVIIDNGRKVGFLFVCFFENGALEVNSRPLICLTFHDITRE